MPSDAERRLAAVIAIAQQERPKWHEKAACRGVGTALFFPEGRGDWRAQMAEAKAYCKVCEVVDECLDDAPSRCGVWGGLSEKQRRGNGKRW